MGDRSTIEWTEATWNPTTGCDRISRGCDNCYALTLAKRLKAMEADKYQADGDPRTSGPGFALTVHPSALSVPYGWKSPRTVFVNSMSDLFHARVPLPFIRQVFDVMVNTPQHTYQILTKRSRRLRQLAQRLPWPDNVWVGVSVEDDKALFRVTDLRRPRLEEIVTNLHERLAEARERGWIGEVEGIEVSIAAAQDKLARMSRIVSLGTPTTRPNGDPP